MDSLTTNASEPTSLDLPDPRLKLEIYRSAIIQFLTEDSLTPISNGDIQTQLIIDREHDHYLILELGWQGEYTRVYGPSIHLDIINGKVWLQCNNTETDVPAELMERGVAREDIVLGKHPPYKRPYIGYAVE